MTTEQRLQRSEQLSQLVLSEQKQRERVAQLEQTLREVRNLIIATGGVRPRRAEQIAEQALELIDSVVE